MFCVDVESMLYLVLNDIITFSRVVSKIECINSVISENTAFLLSKGCIADVRNTSQTLKYPLSAILQKQEVVVSKAFRIK
nr:hypothetical protein B11C_110009 [Bartonella sp. 1-1C]